MRRGLITIGRACAIPTPADLYRALATKPKREALALVSVRYKLANRKTSPRSKIAGKHRKGRLVPERPFMVGTSGPTTMCRKECHVADICYAQRMAYVIQIDQKAAAVHGLTSFDLTRAMIWKLQKMYVGRVPDDGGRDGLQGRDVRINIAGDVMTPLEAAMWAVFEQEWRARGGGVVWGFTRYWRRIPRRCWGSVSITASCSTNEVRDALDAGYPVSVVSDDPTSAREHVRSLVSLPAYMCAYQVAERRSRGDAEHRPVTCAKCRICIDAAPPSFVVVFAEEKGDGEALVQIRPS